MIVFIDSNVLVTALKVVWASSSVVTGEMRCTIRLRKLSLDTVRTKLGS